MSRSALTSLVNRACTSTAGWGETTVFRPNLGTQETINAVFDSAHEMVTLSDGIPISSMRPVVDYTTADLTVQPAVGEQITVGGITYKITDLQPDGDGMVKAILLKAS